MNPPAEPGSQNDATLSQAMDRLWIRFLPEIMERIATLESAFSDEAAKPLPADRRAEAESAAHKLAGVLGTFNLARGTDLARELELAFSRDASPQAQSRDHLRNIVIELRALVENRRLSPDSASETRLRP